MILGCFQTAVPDSLNPPAPVIRAAFGRSPLDWQRRGVGAQRAGAPEHRLRTRIDVCEQHRALTSRWWVPSEVELVRRSDLVEVLPELGARFGIPRSWLKRELWQAVPRAGLGPATLDITRAHWRRMLPGMFRPPTPGRSSARDR